MDSAAQVRRTRHPPPPPSGIITDGLVSRWAFDEGAGTNAGNLYGPDGTLIAMDAGNWVAGWNGTGFSLSFDGSAEYVFVSNSAGSAPYSKADMSTTGLTQCAFINTPRLANGAKRVVMAGIEATGHLDFSAGGLYVTDGVGWLQLGFTVWAGAYVAILAPENDALPGGVWVHVAAMIDPGGGGGAERLRLYVDGIEIASPVAYSPSGIVFDPHYFDIGRSPKTVQHFQGLIDDVRVYARPLTSIELDSIIGGTG